MSSSIFHCGLCWSSINRNQNYCTEPTSCFACRSVGNSSVSLSRCSCCEVRSSSSWTSSSPTPRAANLCPSYSFSSHMDLCLGPLSTEGQGQAGGELSKETFSYTRISPRDLDYASIYLSVGWPWSMMLAQFSMQLFSPANKQCHDCDALRILPPHPSHKHPLSILEIPNVLKHLWH